MTVLIFSSCLRFHFCFVSLDMDIMPKTSKRNSSSSLSIDHGMFKSYSILSRCNSFSSCSDDSVYSGSHSDQKKFKNGKRLVSDNHSSDVPKRSRNSSGSSISSNMSCISDKDLKPSRVMSQTSRSKYQVTKNSVNEVSGPSTNSKINASNVELKEETIVNERLSCSNNSFIISPSQRTLRGKITKKGCTCCPSTRTTVVVRRYREIVKTTEEKTVISSTKVKTYVQKDTVPTTTHISKESKNNETLTRSKSTRKRRSEIEKLYESLHEIEWAKNFSPDNILRQINIRQAASCSLFGRSQINTENLHQKTAKREVNNHESKDNLSQIKINSPVKIKKNYNKHVSVSKIMPSRNTRQNSALPTKDKCQSLDRLKTNKLSESPIYSCKVDHQSFNSQSSLNVLNVEPHSVSTNNMNKQNNNDNQTIHNELPLTMNGADSNDDAQFSCTSDESLSAISSRSVSLQPRQLLDVGCKEKNVMKSLSDVDISEYTTPTFFDIAEEGIRTIDACFREVGAEVIVSTCYDEESSLPLLTCVKENGSSNKSSSNDGPPVLEPCIDININQDSKDISYKSFENQIDELQANTNNSEKGTNSYFNNVKCRESVSNIVKNSASKLLRKQYTYRFNKHKRHSLIIRVVKRILNKYMKQIHSRKHCQLLHKSCLVKSHKGKDEHLKKLLVENESYSTSKENKTIANKYNPALSPISHEVLNKSLDKQRKETVFGQAVKEKQYSYKLEDRVTFGYTNNGCLYGARETLNHKETETHLTSKSESCTFTQCKSIISSYVSSKHENDYKIPKEHISRPPSFGLYSPYRSIIVNRSMNYTQIILKLTRGKSIFLTLEALTELTDVLNRTSNDSSCPVLIINGIGDSFCLGIDLKPLVGPSKNIASTEMAVAIKDLIEALSDFKKPLAAVVNGPALGLGMTLLNHADLTIASEKATFCMPHSYLGYMPEGGATLTLPQVVGSTIAMDLLLRGKTLTAREACNVGLISEVLEAKRLPSELVSRVRVLAENSLSALETTKAVLKMQLHVNLRLVLENEVKLLPRMWLTHSCQDALQKALCSGILSE